MSKSITDRTIALAGIFQVAHLVDQIATKGLYDTSALESSIGSILKLDVDAVVDVFGSIEGVATGLSILVRQLGGNKKDVNMQVTRYVLGILHLENKLNKNPAMLEQITKGITEAKSQSEYFHVTHENVLANLADTYKNTLSTIKPQIMVSGDHGYLHTPENANKVRALLFAGIRSAVLWRQCAGSRWQVLFKRKAFLKEAKRLLNDLRH